VFGIGGSFTGAASGSESPVDAGQVAGRLIVFDWIEF